MPISVNQCGQYILGDREVLDGIVRYIMNGVGKQDWLSHAEEISGYIAAGIQWHPDEVMGYFRSKLR